jgi:molybdopterin synthase sulfur carrier subunit
LATVFIPSGLRAHCGGEDRVEVEASDLRELIARLDERFPGIRERLGEAVAVAIDGEIIQDPYLEPIEPESEVHFLPAISGG